MYWGVQKIQRRINNNNNVEKTIDITWVLNKGWSEPKYSYVSDYLERFDQNFEKFKWVEVDELKTIYKKMWGNPNNFLKDRNALIYLISRMEIKNEQERE